MSELTEYQLICAVDGHIMFQGTRERCIKHVLNDAMALVLTVKSANEYRAEIGVPV